ARNNLPALRAPDTLMGVVLGSRDQVPYMLRTSRYLDSTGDSAPYTRTCPRATGTGTGCGRLVMDEPPRPCVRSTYLQMQQCRGRPCLRAIIVLDACPAGTPFSRREKKGTRFAEARMDPWEGGSQRSAAQFPYRREPHCGATRGVPSCPRLSAYGGDGCRRRGAKLSGQNSRGPRRAAGIVQYARRGGAHGAGKLEGSRIAGSWEA
ncbi:hypothetical protein RF55_25232, partial [Lasius niger]